MLCLQDAQVLILASTADHSKICNKSNLICVFFANFGHRHFRHFFINPTFLFIFHAPNCTSALSLMFLDFYIYISAGSTCNLNKPHSMLSVSNQSQKSPFFDVENKSFIWVYQRRWVQQSDNFFMISAKKKEKMFVFTSYKSLFKLLELE